MYNKNYLASLKHYFLDHARHHYHGFVDKNHKLNMRHYRTCKNRKPKRQMRAELKALRRYWGCIPMPYYVFGFYRSDCELSVEEMKAYIPSYYFYYVIYPAFDDLSSNVFSDDKVLSQFVFLGMGYPLGRVFAVKLGTSVLTLDGQGLDAALFDKRIEESQDKKLFVKPVKGKGGAGIMVATRAEDQFYVGKQKLDLRFMEGLSGDYIVERQIIQSAYISKIYPHSVNTLRVMTKRDNGVVSIINVFLRMGSNGREVDNGSQGGIFVGIDLQTGKATHDYASSERNHDKMYEHPDTGFSIAEVAIREWSQVKSLIIETAQKMILVNLAGWDIALTDDGPLVSEVNTKFGIDAAQNAVGGLQHHFIESDLQAL